MNREQRRPVNEAEAGFKVGAAVTLSRQHEENQRLRSGLEAIRKECSAQVASPFASRIHDIARETLYLGSAR